MNLLKFSILMLMSLALFGCMSEQSKLRILRLTSLFANPPIWIAVEDWDAGPGELYELEEKNGVYRMAYQSTDHNDLENDLEKKYYPVKISGTPFAQETDAEGLLIKNQTHYKYGFETTFDKWTITLIDPNIEPISSQRPNGDYWKINDTGMLEIWSSGAVVETIPNMLLIFIMVSQFEMDEYVESHGGKWHYIDDRGEVLQAQQFVDQVLSGMRNHLALYKDNVRPVWECAEGHQWDAHMKDVRKNNWCPTCFDIETGTDTGGME